MAAGPCHSPQNPARSPIPGDRDDISLSRQFIAMARNFRAGIVFDENAGRMPGAVVDAAQARSFVRKGLVND